MKIRTEVKKRTGIRKKLQRLAAAMLAVVMSITCVNASALTLVPGVYSDVPDNAWYASAVRYCGETGMMNGTGNDTFAPYGKATRAMLVQVLYNMTEQKDPNDSQTNDGQWFGFADVNPERWYYNATIWAYKSGIVEGTGENNLAPTAL